MSKQSINSNVVAASDVFMLERYPARLQQEAKMQGFVHFAEQQAMGVFSAAIGVMANGQPVLLGSFVASRESSGAVLWIARTFENSQLPGTPGTYSSVLDALKAMDDYMIHMARAVARQQTPTKTSFFKKLFSGNS